MKESENRRRGYCSSTCREGDTDRPFQSPFHCELGALSGRFSDRNVASTVLHVACGMNRRCRCFVADVLELLEMAAEPLFASRGDQVRRRRGVCAHALSFTRQTLRSFFALSCHCTILISLSGSIGIERLHRSACAPKPSCAPVPLKHRKRKSSPVPRRPRTLASLHLFELCKMSTEISSYAS